MSIAGNEVIFCLNCHEISFGIFRSPRFYLKSTQLFFSNGIRHLVYNRDYMKSHQYPHNSGLQQNIGTANRILRVYFVFTVRGKINNKGTVSGLTRESRGVHRRNALRSNISNLRRARTHELSPWAL